MTMFGFSKCGSSRCSAIVISTILAVGLALGAAGPARAQTDAEALQVNPVIATQAASGPRTSDFEPPLEDDRSFVTDAAPDLDTGCVFRNFGSIDFDVEVTRAVVMSADDLNADGTLKNAQAMIDAGVLGPKAFLTMPAFDVDVAGAPGFPPEVDKISFNGEEIGELEGINNKWVMNTFDIPIGKVRFPAPGTSGAPQGVANTVRIDIDTASDPSEFNWCTSIDWGALRFKATSPVVLLHGMGANPRSDPVYNSFDSFAFAADLESRFLLVDKDQGLFPGSFALNASEVLPDALKEIATRFGVDSLHLVGHSQGGIDSRAYLALNDPRIAEDGTGFEIVSLTSLAAPHDGTVLADVLKTWGEVVGREGRETVDNFPGFEPILIAMLGRLNIPGADAFTIDRMATFNSGNIPRLRGLEGRALFNILAADADRNGNKEIDSGEFDGIKSLPTVPNLFDFILVAPVDIMYQTVRTVASVEIVETQVDLNANKPEADENLVNVTVLVAVDSTRELENDIIVPVVSALGESGFAALNANSSTVMGAAGRDHMEVLDASVAQKIFPWILDAERARGDLSGFSGADAPL